MKKNLTNKMVEEEWRVIPEFPNYEVSNYGRVRNAKTMHIMKSSVIVSGYMRVTLSKNGYQKCVGIHRLVAEAFLPNPDELSDVAHINDEKLDNRACNLCWMSRKQNLNSGTRNAKLSKKVVQMDLNGKQIAVFPSVTIAAQVLGLDKGNICRVLKGQYKFTGNYKFKYYEN